MIANTIPNVRYDLRGTTANHTNDDSRNDKSHPNAATIRIIIRTGSFATVIANITNGAPNASTEQLKNSARVISVSYDKPNDLNTKSCLIATIISTVTNYE